MDDKTDLERADAWLDSDEAQLLLERYVRCVENSGSALASGLASLLATVRREARERALEEAEKVARAAFEDYESPMEAICALKAKP